MITISLSIAPAFVAQLNFIDGFKEVFLRTQIRTLDSAAETATSHPRHIRI